MKTNNRIDDIISGIGFTGLLTSVFITLKLCHVINWSWLWVLSPVWISPGISIAVVILCMVIREIKK